MARSSYLSGNPANFFLPLRDNNDKAKPVQRRGRKATGPRFVREATDDSPKDATIAGLRSSLIYSFFVPDCAFMIQEVQNETASRVRREPPRTAHRHHRRNVTAHPRRSRLSNTVGVPAEVQTEKLS